MPRGERHRDGVPTRRTQKQREEVLDNDGSSINCLQRQDSNKSLNLQDIFDGIEWAHLFEYPSHPAELLSKLKESHTSSGILTFSRLHTLTIDFDDQKIE